MTQYTCNQAQTYWDQPNHFTPNGTPGNGDTIIAPTGTWLHVVGTQEIGTSAAMGADTAILFQGPNCQLVLELDSFLRYRGEIFQTGGGASVSQWCRVSFKPGSTLWHDSTAATDPTNQHYAVQLGSGTNLYCHVDFTESNDPNNRVTIGSETGGGRGWFDAPDFLRLGGAYAPEGTGWVDHVRWGGRDATNYSYTVRAGLGVTGMQWRNMSFTDCGGIYMPAVTTAAQPVFEDMWFGDTKTTFCINAESTGRMDADGVMRRITFDRYVQIILSADWQVYECIFGERGPALINGPASIFEKVIVINTNTSAWSTWGGEVSNLTYIVDHNLGNPHGVQSMPSVGTNKLIGYVFIYTGDPKVDAGDAILGNGSGPHHIQIERALVMDDKGHNANDSTLLSLLGGTDVTVSLKDCTCVGHGVHSGETFAGETGQITSMANCLSVSYSGASRWKLRDINPGTTTPKVLNPVIPANARHNGGFGLAVGSNGKSYDSMNLAPDDGTIGANDIDDVDPAFKTMLYLGDFDAQNGGDGTNASAVANILNWNHPTLGNPGYSPLSLFNFFLGSNDNWSPTAPEYENSGVGGVGDTIGAKAWIPAAQPPPTSTGGFEVFGPGVFE